VSLGITSYLVKFTGIGYNACMTNKYTYCIPFTEEELYRDYVELRMSQDEIAKKYETSQHVVWRAMHKMGIPTRIAAKRNQSGSLNSFWKGGRVLMAVSGRQRGERTSFGNGYFYILDPTHPNANKSGYVAEHILIATKERGKPLTEGELVHHVNLDKHDNRPENLMITISQTHANWHNQLEEIAVSFMQEGLITFDPTEGYKRAK
jgi:hypothetical protein